MARRKKTRIVLGVITAREQILNTSIGHQSHISGTGAHRSKKHDRKLRRKRDKQATKGWD